MWTARALAQKGCMACAPRVDCSSNLKPPRRTYTTQIQIVHGPRIKNQRCHLGYIPHTWEPGAVRLQRQLNHLCLIQTLLPARASSTLVQRRTRLDQMLGWLPEMHTNILIYVYVCISISIYIGVYISIFLLGRYAFRSECRFKCRRPTGPDETTQKQ